MGLSDWFLYTVNTFCETGCQLSEIQIQNVKEDSDQDMEEAQSVSEQEYLNKSSSNATGIRAFLKGLRKNKLPPETKKK